MAYNITSSSQIIDIVTINNGCTQIEKAAEKFLSCAEMVLSASDICNDKALSVDKTTMQPQLDADAEYIKSMQASALAFTSTIRSLALQIYSEQQAELSNYIAQQQAAQNATNGSN